MAIIALKQDIHNILRNYKSVAVLGASLKKSRPAHYVPAYLKTQGFNIFPVNPVYAGQYIFAKKIEMNLRDIPESIEIVNVFRRSEHLMDGLEGILELKPTIVWLQKGIKNSEYAQILGANGIDVVEDKCMLEEHKSMLNES